MAKIVVNVDTESKTLEVFVNGQSQTDVNSVNFCLRPSYEYKDEMELDVSIMMSTEDESTGIRTMKYITAKQNKIPGALPSKTYGGLYELQKVDSAKHDIKEFFKHF